MPDKILFLIYSFCVLIFFSNNAFADSLNIKLGSLNSLSQESESRLIVEFNQELSRIPLITPEDGGYFGLQYQVDGVSSYKVKLWAYIPRREVSEVVKNGDYRENIVVDFREMLVADTNIQLFTFDKSDVEGTYKLLFEIEGPNGIYFEELIFEVYRPEEKEIQKYRESNKRILKGNPLYHKMLKIN